jgi:histidinol dehydrogenase
MKTFKYPSPENWEKLLQRPSFETKALDTKVSEILEQVKNRGDEAVIEFTKKFDNASIDKLQISEDEILEAEKLVSEKLKESINIAIKNITSFHNAQLPKSIDVETLPGVRCWQKPVPITKVGLYIPGGTAPLFSTILILLGVQVIFFGFLADANKPIK